jgi:dipeptidyl-peptidase-4
VTDSYPRLAARTMNFSLGLPRALVVSPDGGRIAFLRAEHGTTRSHSLWVYDVESGGERKVADAAALLAENEAEELSAEERARRERMRVGTSGIVAFSTDDDVTVAAFALSSRLFVADLRGARAATEIPVSAPVIDPRLDPSGRMIAYAGDRGLHLVDQFGTDRVLVGPSSNEPGEVVWGLAEFIAAEELDRTRGFWWAPDSSGLLVERYDETPVPVWHIADPAHPEVEPVRQRYPQAGKANAIVSLHWVPLDGERVDLQWRSDRELDGQVFEYLAEVSWSAGRPIAVLLTRDQRRLEIREVDVETGASTVVQVATDDRFVELTEGTPRRTKDGRLLHGVVSDDTYRLAVDGEAFTPAGLQVRSLLAVEDDAVIASVVPKIASVSVARLGYDGSVSLLSDPDGVALGAAGGGTTVIQYRSLTGFDVTTSVSSKGSLVGTLTTLNEQPPLRLNMAVMQVGSRDYPTALVFPSWHVPGSRRLPVLMDPYGGPHGQRVVNAAHFYLSSQWFADQGFVVVVADGRGMAGRGPAWDRLAYHDFIGTIDDQAEVLTEIARRYPDDVDATRVAIRGWSFGGYIAAAGVLRRPDIFTAAVAGAPVSDQRLYDTCYSERYLGHPDTDREVYDANDLTLLAGSLNRPLMLIHGLADDNVAFAHTMKLSTALLAEGKPHSVLPLSGITHMANTETVAESLLLLQVDFLRRSLGVPSYGN